jgi:hypothetical protein
MVWFPKCYPLLRNISCWATCYLAVTHSVLFIVMGTWFPIHCSARDIFSGSTIPAISCHVTILNEYEIFGAIQGRLFSVRIMVFWVMTPCKLIDGFQHFGKTFTSVFSTFIWNTGTHLQYFSVFSLFQLPVQMKIVVEFKKELLQQHCFLLVVLVMRCSQWHTFTHPLIMGTDFWCHKFTVSPRPTNTSFLFLTCVVLLYICS